MIFLYKLSLLNENEIRNGLQPRFVYVAASSMADAITGYSEDGSMISSCEFLYPISLVCNGSDSKYTIDSSDVFYRVVYRPKDIDTLRSALVRASDGNTALLRLSQFLHYSPEIEHVYMLDDLVL